MSRKEAVLLVSRATAVYLLCWAIDVLTFIPERIFAFAHHASLNSLLQENYLRNLDLISLALLFVRIIGLFAAASWFYSCGPKVEDYFFSTSEAAQPD